MSAHARFLVRLIIVVLVCALFQFPLHAQNAGAIAGCVFDQTESVIPGVTVELASQTAKISKTAMSGADGTYRFDDLLPGPAEITFRLINFSTVRRVVAVRAGMVSTIDVTLVVSSSADMSRLPGEPLTGVADVHAHPALPRTLRLSFQVRF